MDPFACTMALHRLARYSHDVDKHAANARAARPVALNPTRGSLSQREQRLWRASFSASVKQHPSFAVLLERIGSAEALKHAQPRQLANMSWALARLRALEGLPLLRAAARRCAAREGPGEWDPMSISLIPWSLATMNVAEPWPLQCMQRSFVDVVEQDPHQVTKARVAKLEFYPL